MLSLKGVDIKVFKNGCYIVFLSAAIIVAECVRAEGRVRCPEMCVRVRGRSRSVAAVPCHWTLHTLARTHNHAPLTPSTLPDSVLLLLKVVRDCGLGRMR